MAKYYAKENLSEIADGDQDFLKILAQTFLDEIPSDLHLMEEAIFGISQATDVFKVRNVIEILCHWLEPHIV